jgi:hypothetical protein
MNKVCVVHLVRQGNPVGALNNFLESYEAKTAGMPHDFLILFKGFSVDLPNEYRNLLSRFTYRSMFTPDVGFDITPYFQAVHDYRYEYFVFLNSFSVILGTDWMAKMFRHVTMPNVGAVGATGSWETQYGLSPGQKSRTRLIGALKQLRALVFRDSIPLFPNYHLRTNSFMAPRELLLKICVPLIKNKKDAHAFESGPSSFTRQIIAMNKRVLVTGSDGRFYEKESWPCSGTFRQAEQENLLIADNQTYRYQMGDLEMRRRLSIVAWGNKSEFA